MGGALTTRAAEVRTAGRAMAACTGVVAAVAAARTVARVTRRQAGTAGGEKR